MRSYHQTQLLAPEVAALYEVKAENQEIKILSLFRASPTRTFTAEGILQDHRILDQDTPLTSVRRALTNLNSQGEIVKVGQALGMYGRPVNVYRLYRWGIPG